MICKFCCLQIFHIPCLVQELYLNFDCDLHATNVLEDVCKTLSKVSRCWLCDDVLSVFHVVRFNFIEVD